MVQLEKACCCLSLRTGNLVLGWLHVILGTILLILVAVGLAGVDMQNDEKMDPKQKHDAKVALAVLLVVFCISPLIGVCHLYGSYKYRKGFLLPYIIGGGIQLFFTVVSIILSIVSGDTSKIISQIIGLAIMFYLYLIPWSFYKEIKTDRAAAMQRA